MTINWKEWIEQQKKEDYFQKVTEFVASERAVGKVIYPEPKEVFTAFEQTEFDDVKVVILGQDPYHGPKQAHGLSFSVLPDIKTPPSLANIYKELATDIEGFTTPNHGYLMSWAKQGVLLLNTVLTVEQAKAHSHAKSGWETFTSNAIELLNQNKSGVIFLLWGAHAQKKGQMIDTKKHYVLKAPHPSPLSAHRGFLGCRHFSEVNRILKSSNKDEINWQI